MLSKTAIHAVTALTALAELPEGAYGGAADIANEIGAPPNYLGKLLKTLADEGLVESQKGKGGGFRLAKEPAAISVFEIVDPVERLSRWSGCFLGRGKCTDTSPCAVHQRWARVREVYLAFLKQTTLADLVKKPALSSSLSGR